MTRTLWSALADRFEALAGSFELRIAFVPDEQVGTVLEQATQFRPLETDALKSIPHPPDSSSLATFATTTSENYPPHNRLRWLCGLAGRLLPASPRNPVLEWLLEVFRRSARTAADRPGFVEVTNAARASAELARQFANDPPARQPTRVLTPGSWQQPFRTLREAFYERSRGGRSEFGLELIGHPDAQHYLFDPEFGVIGRKMTGGVGSGPFFDEQGGAEHHIWAESGTLRLFTELAEQAGRNLPQELRLPVRLLPAGFDLLPDYTESQPIKYWLEFLWLSNPANYGVYLITPEWNGRKAVWQAGNPHLASVLAIDEHLLGFSHETAYTLDRRSVQLFPWFTDDDRAAALLVVDAIHGRCAARHADVSPRQGGSKPVTFGELMQSVRSLDAFRRQQESDTDDSPSSSYARLTAAVNIAEVEQEHRSQPGYDRLEAYVNAKFGPMDYQGLCWLRGQLCTTRNCGTVTADAMTLMEAANALGCPGGPATGLAGSPSNQGRGEFPSDGPPVTDPLAQLNPAQQIAWSQYLDARRQNSSFGEDTTDRAVYSWLAEKGGYELPGFETWCRYVRAARNAVGERKHTPRAGREGRSVVRRDQV